MIYVLKTCNKFHIPMVKSSGNNNYRFTSTHVYDFIVKRNMKCRFHSKNKLVRASQDSSRMISNVSFLLRQPGSKMDAPIYIKKSVCLD